MASELNVTLQVVKDFQRIIDMDRDIIYRSLR